ncbi:MAG: CHASE2 domain-containing protein [Magnetococcales bacterium]|nr:CHASE2 domain-containing protein [Magnetococcales bacterium]
MFTGGDHLIRTMLFVGLLLFGVAFSWGHWPVTERFDRVLWDRISNLLRVQHLDTLPKKSLLTPHQDPVVVGVDAEAERLFQDRPQPLWHAHWGDFFQAMALAKPSVVGVDYILPASSYDDLFHHFLSGYLPRLAQVSGKPELADVAFSEFPPGYGSELRLGLLSMLQHQVPLVLGQFWDQKGQEFTIDRSTLGALFAMGPLGDLAYLYVPVGSDGISRAYLGQITRPEAQRRTLAARMAAMIDPKHIEKKRTSGLIDYTIGAPFKSVSFVQVIEWLKKRDVAALEAHFQGRPVLLGDTAGYLDLHQVPVANLVDGIPVEVDSVPGVYVHAQALRTLLWRGMMTPPERFQLWGSSLPMLLGTLLLCGLFWLGRTPMAALLTYLALLTAGWWAAKAAVSSGVAVPLTAPIVTGTLALLLGLGAEGVISVLERRRLRTSFGSYVSPQVLEQIQTGVIHPQLGGVKMEVCVLMSDIRSFTTRSEHQPAEAIVSLLNQYFTQMTESVHAHNGTLDKFIGDGILAFYGAPGKTIVTPSDDAFRSALDMLKRLDQLNIRLKKQGIEPIKIGIGLHVGSAIVGHVGSNIRHEYTVIGDTVNASARIEGLTKNVGYPILCSDDVFKQLKDPNLRERLTALGAMQVKGREAIEVYGWKPELNELDARGENNHDT